MRGETLWVLIAACGLSCQGGANTPTVKRQAVAHAPLVQNSPDAMHAQDPEVMRERLMRATMAPQLAATTENGFTVWRKDVNSGCSYADHNYTLDVPADPKDMSEISYSMNNYDVDYDTSGCDGGPEVDLMSLNGNALGRLTGANDSWSVNTWPLTQTQVVQGSNTIFIDTDATNTGCWCVGVGWIEIRAKVGFQVKDKTPQDNDKNRDFHAGKVDLTVTFSGEYDDATLTADTFKLEYRDAGGAWQSVAGSFARLAPEKFRFTPNADLKDAVKYRVTIKGGENGVRGSENQGKGQLAADEQWSFWTVPDLDRSDAFNAGSGSLCPPATSPCDGLEVAVFQTARNADMVPNKAGAVRLYLRWKKHTDVHPDDIVKELEVDAKVTNSGATLSATQTVKRPDLITAAEKRAAQNTVNLYQAKVTSYNYDAEVTPKPQTNATAVKFTKNNTRTAIAKASTLKANHYMLKGGTWAAGAPAAARAGGAALMVSGAQAITDMFPLLGTTFTSKGDIAIGYTFTGNTVACDGSGGPGPSGPEVNCAVGGGAVVTPELLCIYATMEATRGTDTMIAVTIPSSVCTAITGAAANKVFFHAYGTPANAETIAHETAHVFGVTAHRNSSVGVEGFQVRTKVNRSNIENSAKAISLMHEAVQPTGTQWPHNDDYAALIPPAVALPFAPLHLRPALLATPYLIVSGFINLGAGTATLAPAYLQEAPKNPPSASGPCTVSLLDAAGGVLASDFVTPLAPPIFQRQAGAAGASAAAIAGPAYFSASLPWSDAARRLEVRCGGPVLAAIDRSAHEPTVDFVGVADGDTLSGLKALAWSAADADVGDLMSYQLQLLADDATWSPLTGVGAGQSYDLDTTLLSSGPHTLRVMVTDGFNTTYATRTVTVSNPLTVLSVSPFDAEQGVPVATSIQVRFASDVEPASLAGGLTLLQNGVYTQVDASYDAATRTATFTPIAPLAPNALCTATVNQNVVDTNGATLAAPYTWQFTTEADLVPPRVIRQHPADGAADVPLNSLVQAAFDKDIDAATLDAASFTLTGSAGPVAASIVYDSVARHAVLVPSAPLAAETLYTARLTTAIKDSAGNALEQDISWSFTTGDAAQTSNQLRIVGNYNDTAHDTNADGLYDDLTIDTDVEVLAAGYYNLNARLTDRAGKLIAWQTTGTVYLNVGVHTLSLVYGSVPIRSAGVDGPYVFDSVNFYDVLNPGVSEQRYRAYQTFAYKASSFFATLSLRALPDQLLLWNTTRDNAFNLRDFTSHATLPVSSVSYRILVNTDPRAGVSIDADANVDINPDPGVEADSEVTIEATDTLGNRVTSTFHVRVQAPRASAIEAPATLTVGAGQSAPLAVTVKDQFGAVFGAPIEVTFSATDGSVSPPSATTAGGVAQTTYTAPATPGAAFITVRAGAASAVVNVEITATPPSAVTLSGPAAGVVNTAYTFTATVEPAGAATPITYTWKATDLADVVHTGGTTDTATFTWTIAGPKTVEVEARNSAGAVSARATITIAPITTHDQLYPIGIAASALRRAVPGRALSLWSGFGVFPGEFSWLSWTGSQAQSTLAHSLTPPGDSDTYVNPNDPSDHLVTAGDWVRGVGNASNNAAVRAALDGLMGRPITVMVWDRWSWWWHTRYRAAGYACVAIERYRLWGVDEIRVKYLGAGACAQP